MGSWTNERNGEQDGKRGGVRQAGDERVGGKDRHTLDGQTDGRTSTWKEQVDGRRVGEWVNGVGWSDGHRFRRYPDLNIAKFGLLWTLWLKRNSFVVMSNLNREAITFCNCARNLCI